MSYNDQQWEPVVIKKKLPKGASAKSEKVVNAARRQGLAVDTVSKYGAATNKHSVTTLNTAKLDQESEELKHDKVPLEIGKLIQKGRQDKGLTQKDLATVHSCLIIEIFFALEIEMLPLLLYFFNRYAENQ